LFESTNTRNAWFHEPENKVLKEKVYYTDSKVPYNENKQPLYKLQILVQLGLNCLGKK
jgi:hypothetical protein